MSNEIFGEIRELKQQGNYVAAWETGYAVFQNDTHNTFLRTSLFWVCYAAIKAVQEPILNRQNKAPNSDEADTVNAWISCIGSLKLEVPCDELDFRFFNLFKGCGQHYHTYIQMLSYLGHRLLRPDDLKPFKTERGEYPSLAVRLARQASKAWLQHHKEWDLNLEDILNLLRYADDRALDRDKMWLKYDISKCLVSVNRFDEAREAALTLIKRKMSESWAWGALADTYTKEDPEAAITCYCKGIIEAFEPPFCIPMYFGLAQLFSLANNVDLASSSLSRLIEIYNANGWKLKPEHDALVQEPWFDASAIERTDFDAEIKARAKNALQYATGKLVVESGIVDSHHRSGKGCSIYIDVGRKVSARKGVFSNKELPSVGTWVELKVASDGEKPDVIEARKIEQKKNDKVQTIFGSLRLNPKGFGFVEDVFIAPHLLTGFEDNENIEAIKVWDIDPKKGKPSWRAIKVNKSELEQKESC